MRVISAFRHAGAAKVFFAGILSILLSAINLYAFKPEFKPAINIMPTTTPVKIDGQVSDAAWTKASKLDNFVETYPGDNIEPDVKTKAFVTYDDHNFYVAFVCYDDPKGIRATMCQRDQYSGDDIVTVFIDPYANASWAYWFRVNPYGIQKDFLWTPLIGSDQGYDLIWESAAVVTDSGWQAEMAIPFSSMRFPNKDVQTWKVDFERMRLRETSKEYNWAARDRNEQCFPCQYGTITGIANVEPGKGIEILPTMVAHQSGEISDLSSPNSRFDNADPKAELSLGLKYAINSDVTIEGALNPDFSQIEADAAQIDVNSTIALLYPERRPYFQEGSDIFRTLFNSFYTRTVNDPQFTAKLTGRMNQSSIGFLSARDQNSPYMIPMPDASIIVNNGKSYVNVLRASRAFGSDSRIGFMLADRRFDDDGSNTIGALDCDIRLTKNYSIDGQWLLAHTTEPTAAGPTARYAGRTFDDGKHTVAFDGESFQGTGLITRLKRESRHWNFVIDYNQVSPSYRTEVGFDPYMNYRNASLATSYTIYPKSSLFSTITPQYYTLYRWRFDGTRRLQLGVGGIETQLRKAQTYISLNYRRTGEYYGGIDFDNLWEVSAYANCRLNRQLGFGVGVTRGVNVAYYALAKGNTLEYNASLDLKPVDRLIIQPSISFARNSDRNTGEEFYSGYITRTRVLYQANRELSLRLIVQYDDFSRAWEIDPLLTYRLSPFSLFYVGSASDYYDFAPDKNSPSNWRLASRQFFMKMQYLFQT